MDRPFVYVMILSFEQNLRAFVVCLTTRHPSGDCPFILLIFIFPFAMGRLMPMANRGGSHDDGHRR